MKIYIDTSFLISLYSLDVNSSLAIQSMQAAEGNRFTSALGDLEMVNGLGLRVFRKEVSPAQSAASLRDFEKDVRDGVLQLLPVSQNVFDKARQLSWRTTSKLGTRTADLLHVAAALELGADYFYSFDKQQRKLAESLRLKVN